MSLDELQEEAHRLGYRVTKDYSGDKVKMVIEMYEYNYVTFLTPDGREFKYLPLEVIDTIKAEIEKQGVNSGMLLALEIIDREVKKYTHE